MNRPITLRILSSLSSLRFGIKAIRSVLPFMMVALFSSAANAETGGIDSLRSIDLTAQPPAEALKKVQESDTILNRDFIQQPPLIPHDVRNYSVNKDVNSCLQCHSWKNASKWGATRISVTHFYDRDGKQLADVAPNRYFCLQCHVPQADTKLLKENTFEPVDALK